MQINIQQIITSISCIRIPIDMLYRANGGIFDSGRLKRNDTIYFDTYFNVLSIEKWLRYTSVSAFGLHIRYKGHILLHLIHLIDTGLGVEKRNLSVGNVNAPYAMMIHRFFVLFENYRTYF